MWAGYLNKKEKQRNLPIKRLKKAKGKRESNGHIHMGRERKALLLSQVGWVRVIIIINQNGNGYLIVIVWFGLLSFFQPSKLHFLLSFGDVVSRYQTAFFPPFFSFIVQK